MRNIILAICGIILTGCYIQSLNRFYTDDQKIDFPEIYGEWISSVQTGEDVSNRQISPWIFYEDEIESYDRDNTFGELEAVYFRIGETVLLDFTAGEPSRNSDGCGNLFWDSGITQTHSLCKVSLDKEILVITPLNFDWFEDQIEAGSLNLSFVKADANSNYVFTASADQWSAFLKENINSRDLFDESNQFVFRRK